MWHPLGLEKRKLVVSLLVWKLADQAQAVAQCGEHGTAPAARHKRSRLLIDRLVGFSEEAHTLARRRRRKFLHCNAERDVARLLPFHHREKMKLRQLLGGISLQVRPLAHPRSSSSCLERCNGHRSKWTHVRPRQAPESTKERTTPILEMPENLEISY